ncbi:transposase-like protein [Sodalis ligni]|uniref:Transposase-like protein n=1 Tax=Sodalis ligni TaxID=2697027 RepID=A0A4R1NH09_9GAMM|nr:transposase-like protein [Sodalis ligni]
MIGRTKRTFSVEFKLEAARLILDRHHSVVDAAKALNAGISTMGKWVRQLNAERKGLSPNAFPITLEQIEIRELKKRLQHIEMENEILKKATALLMSYSLNNFRSSRNSERVIPLPLCATCLGFTAAATKYWRNRPGEPDAEHVALPSLVWCGDVTYLRTGACRAYLAVVTDLFAFACFAPFRSLPSDDN